MAKRGSHTSLTSAASVWASSSMSSPSYPFCSRLEIHHDCLPPPAHGTAPAHAATRVFSLTRSVHRYPSSSKTDLPPIHAQKCRFYSSMPRLALHCSRQLSLPYLNIYCLRISHALKKQLKNNKWKLTQE